MLHLQTKQIKLALCKHMIHDCFMNPSRETTDKALAEAAGKPVLELLSDAPAYASYKQKATPAWHAQNAMHCLGRSHKPAMPY